MSNLKLMRCSVAWLPSTMSLLILNLLLGGLTMAQDPINHAADPAAEQRQISELLGQQAIDWNAGDLKKFMQSYWNSEQLTFSSGGQTTRGWQATLDRYQTKYSTPDEMGRLTFDQNEITMLGSEAALVLGTWQLKWGNDRSRGGNFSLVLQKIDGHWKIIHDHTSELKAP